MVVRNTGSRPEQRQPIAPKELLPLRVRLPFVGTIDEETEQEMINKTGRST